MDIESIIIDSFKNNKKDRVEKAEKKEPRNADHLIEHGVWFIGTKIHVSDISIVRKWEPVLTHATVIVGNNRVRTDSTKSCVAHNYFNFIRPDSSSYVRKKLGKYKETPFPHNIGEVQAAISSKYSALLPFVSSIGTIAGFSSNTIFNRVISSRIDNKSIRLGIGFKEATPPLTLDNSPELYMRSARRKIKRIGLISSPHKYRISLFVRGTEKIQYGNKRGGLTERRGLSILEAITETAVGITNVRELGDAKYLLSNYDSYIWNNIDNCDSAYCETKLEMYSKPIVKYREAHYDTMGKIEREIIKEVDNCLNYSRVIVDAPATFYKRISRNTVVYKQPAYLNEREISTDWSTPESFIYERLMHTKYFPSSLKHGIEIRPVRMIEGIESSFSKTYRIVGSIEQMVYYPSRIVNLLPSTCIHIKSIINAIKDIRIKQNITPILNKYKMTNIQRVTEAAIRSVSKQYRDTTLSIIKRLGLGIHQAFLLANPIESNRMLVAARVGVGKTRFAISRWLQLGRPRTIYITTSRLVNEIMYDKKVSEVAGDYMIICNNKKDAETEIDEWIRSRNKILVTSKPIAKEVLSMKVKIGLAIIDESDAIIRQDMSWYKEMLKNKRAKIRNVIALTGTPVYGIIIPIEELVDNYNGSVIMEQLVTSVERVERGLYNTPYRGWQYSSPDAIIKTREQLEQYIDNVSLMLMPASRRYMNILTDNEIITYGSGYSASSLPRIFAIEKAFSRQAWGTYENMLFRVLIFHNISHLRSNLWRESQVSPIIDRAFTNIPGNVGKLTISKEMKMLPLTGYNLTRAHNSQYTRLFANKDMFRRYDDGTTTNSRSIDYIDEYNIRTTNSISINRTQMGIKGGYISYIYPKEMGMVDNFTRTARKIVVDVEYDTESLTRLIRKIADRYKFVIDQVMELETSIKRLKGKMGRRIERADVYVEAVNELIKAIRNRYNERIIFDTDAYYMRGYSSSSVEVIDQPGSLPEKRGQSLRITLYRGIPIFLHNVVKDKVSFIIVRNDSTDNDDNRSVEELIEDVANRLENKPHKDGRYFVAFVVNDSRIYAAVHGSNIHLIKYHYEGEVLKVDDIWWGLGRFIGTLSNIAMREGLPTIPTTDTDVDSSIRYALSLYKHGRTIPDEEIAVIKEAISDKEIGSMISRIMLGISHFFTHIETKDPNTKDWKPEYSANLYKLDLKELVSSVYDDILLENELEEDKRARYKALISILSDEKNIPAILFMRNSRTAKTMVNRLRNDRTMKENGISVIGVTSSTRTGKERDKINSVGSGKYVIVSTIDILHRGFNMGSARSVILYEQPKSVDTTKQCIGRIERPDAEGEAYAYIIRTNNPYDEVIKHVSNNGEKDFSINHNFIMLLKQTIEEFILNNENNPECKNCLDIKSKSSILSEYIRRMLLILLDIVQYITSQ